MTTYSGGASSTGRWLNTSWASNVFQVGRVYNSSTLQDDYSVAAALLETGIPNTATITSATIAWTHNSNPSTISVALIDTPAPTSILNAYRTASTVGEVTSTSGTSRSADVTAAVAGLLNASGANGNLVVRWNPSSQIAAARNITSVTLTIEYTTAQDYAVAGTVQAVSAVSGTIGLRRQLAGSAAAQSGASGTIGLQRQLAGTVQAVSASAGGIGLRRQLAGTVSAQSGSSGNLLVDVSNPLVGTVQAQSGVQGALLITANLAGTVPAVAATSGGINLRRTLAGTVQAAASTSGAIGLRRQLAGTVAAVSGVLGWWQAAAVRPRVPWQILVHTDAWRDAITAQDRRVSIRVEVIDLDGGVLEQFGGDSDLPAPLGGEVKHDVDQTTRRDGYLEVASQLAPLTPADLLSWTSTRRARIWWGLHVAGGEIHEVPLATLFFAKPDLSTAVGGARVNLESAITRIRQRLVRTPLDLSGARIDTALRAHFATYAPWATVNIADSADTLPAGFLGGEPRADPWDVAVQIAAAGGLVLDEDRYGTVTAQPLTERLRDITALVDGEDCAFDSMTLSMDDADLATWQAVESASDEIDPPLLAVAELTDTSHALYDRHRVGMGIDDWIQNAIVTSQSQAETFADNRLGDSLSAVQLLSIRARADGSLQGGDLVPARSLRLGLTGQWSIRSISHVVKSTGGMQLTVSQPRRL